MPIGKNIPAFEAEFACYRCKRVIGVKLARAIVESQTGAEVTCGCGQWYRVTMEGAQAIERKPERPPMVGKMELQPVHDAGETPDLRFPQSGEQGEQRSGRADVWALRMPRVRRDP